MASANNGIDDEDDYYKYDPFEGIDLDAIPELTPTQLQHAGPSRAAPASSLHQCPPQAQDQPENSRLDKVTDVPSTPLPSGAHNKDRSATQFPPTGSGGDSPSTEYAEEDYNDDFLAQLDSLESDILKKSSQICEHHRLATSIGTSITTS